METVKRGVTLRLYGVLAAGVLLSMQPRMHAQQGASQAAAQAQAQSGAEKVLIEKARALDARGRVDLGAQNWQQVLLSDPMNTEALAGAARDEMQMGNSADGRRYLDRLATINPKDPRIAEIEGMKRAQAASPIAQRAGKLAQQGQYSQAMDLYRQAYGTTPPAGDIALAYYETEAALPQYREQAVQALRDLATKYPDDPRYEVAVGRILTFDPKTRKEGVALLQKHQNDPQAKLALRQALTWDADNPATIPEMRAFLKSNTDPELQQRLQATETRQAKLSAGLAKSEEERLAYAAMSANKLEDAQRRFEAILAHDTNNPRALAGLGFLDMRRSNFAGAVTYLESAEANGMRDKAVVDALATSRFWNAMGQATTALNQNQTDVAIQGYRAALAMRPGNAAALQGLAGALLKQQPLAAEAIYREWLRTQPKAPEAWLGLFTAQSLAGDSAGALMTSRQMPDTVRRSLSQDPTYLRTLASAYTAAGQDAEAQRVLQQALNLPLPNGGVGMKAATQMQYAGLLEAAGRPEQAAGMYRQVIAADPANVDAYQGLIRAMHAMNQDAQALQTMEAMPPEAREAAQRDAGFQLTLASIYISQGRYDVAQGLLEQALASANAAGRTPPAGLTLQLASVYAAQGNTPQALALYQQVLTADPTRADAWTGLLSALHVNGRDREALAELPVIPRPTYAKLNQDPQFLEVLASIYTGAGNTPLAMSTLRAVTATYQRENRAVPASVELQYAWLLLNSGDNAGLYTVLTQLQVRTDLTNEQMGTVQTIWATWSVQRAAQYAKRGNPRKGIEILDAANRAFPNNLTVEKALAGGYAQAGDPKRAVGIYLSINWNGATAADYRGAIGAALAARDLRQADAWLEEALKQYPNDAQILQQAGQYEQARGDKSRAVDYFKASLEAMGPPDPNETLTHEMQMAPPTGNVQQMSPTQDLQRLMAPGADTGSTVPTPLPSYASSFAPGPVAPPVPINSYAAPGPAQAPPIITSEPVPSSGKKKLPPPPPPTRLGDYNPQSELQPSPLTAQDELALNWMAGAGEAKKIESADEWSVRPVVWQQAATPQDDGSAPHPKMHLVMRPEPGQAATAQPAAVAPEAAKPQTAAPGQMLPMPRATAQAAPRGSAMQNSAKQNSSTQNSAGQYATAPVNQAVPATQPIAQTDAPMKLHLRMPGAPRTETATTNSENAVAAPVATPVKSQPVPVASAKTTSPAPRRTPVTHTAAAAPPAVTTTPATSEISETPRTVETVPGIQYVPTTSTQQVKAAQYQGQSAPPPAQLQPQQQYVQPPQYTAQQQYNQAQPPVQQQYISQPQQQSAPPLPPPPAQRAQNNSGAYSSSGAASTAPPPAQVSGQPGYGTYSQPPGQPYNPSYGPGYSYYNDAQAPVQQQPNFQRVLPPLSGYGQQQTAPHGQQTTREQVEEQLATIEGSYSPWLGATALGSYRSGTPGFDRFAYFSTPIEASAVLGDSVRATVVVNPVIIDAGTPVATSTYRQGTLPAAAIPFTQTAAGTGGEIQLRTQNFGVAAGYTPYGFLVGNIIGRLYMRPGNGPFTFTFSRDAVTDTQLSYSGLRDLGQAPADPIWGGVVANSGEIQIASNSDHSGYYVQGGGQYITGTHVQTNWRGDGDAGAYWRIKTWPEYGSLTLGMNVFGMHYEHNLRYFTYGQGGYFSPQAYLLANVPVRFDGHYGRNLHYRIEGSLGIQGFQEDTTPYFPIDSTIQSKNGNLFYPTNNRVGGNYLFDSEVSYRVTDHWYAGAFINANNTRDYNNVMGGFYVRYMFRAQYPTEEGPPTGIFPISGLRPITVP